jgi:hypothetical protein
MMKVIVTSLIGLTFAFTVGCSTKRLSDRDKFLQEQQQGADLKRGELNTVAGEYLGELIGSDGLNHNVRLILQVKDVSETKGDADPVLIPKLLGSLRFILGNEDMNEVIDCPIKTSEYVKARGLISIVVSHAQFGELVISGTADGSTVSGTWNASSVSRNGRILVRKVN